MNKENGTVPSVVKSAKEYLRGKWKDILLIGVLAIALLFAVSRVFQEEKTQSVSLQRTETEEKISRLLQEIEGVGEAEVIVCENENGKTSVVVVCDGAKDIRVALDVREAVASALGTEQNSVKIYQKK